MKIKKVSQNRIIFFLVLLIILTIGFGFGKGEKAEAAENGTCIFTAEKDVSANGPFGGFVAGTDYEFTDISAESCRTKCRSAGIINENKCLFSGPHWYSWSSPVYETINDEKVAAAKAAEAAAKDKDKVCPDISLYHPMSWFTCLFLYVLNFMGLLIQAAATLFVQAIDPGTYRVVLGANPVIYETWAMVRDTLNICFILVLLFSAFATIFQIEKYSYKNILKTLIIMALLVNFSFPIARFIIDVSNVMMYYIVNNFGIIKDTGSIFATYGDNSALAKILHPSNNPSISFLLASIVFAFIFAITLLVIAVLFIIRLVVLSFLVIFSSVAFIGPFVPFLSSQSNKWWDALFKNAFFGPAMVFMLYIAMRMMSLIDGSGLIGGFGSAAGNQSLPQDASTIAALAFFAIPIVILWAGLGAAQTLGAFGATAVTGAGKKLMKGASGYNWAKKQYGDYKKVRDEHKEAARIKPAKLFGEKVNNLQDRAMARANKSIFSKKKPRKDTEAGKRYNKRRDEENKKNIKEESEKHDGTTEAELYKDMNTLNADRFSKTKGRKLSDSEFATAQNEKIKKLKNSEVKEAAGKAKQALSRGSSFEKEIENDLKDQDALKVGLTGEMKPTEYKAKITSATSPGQIAIERDKEKAAKDAINEWIRKEKVVRLDQMRAVIKEAENRGKLT